jgi:hypothetical protein
MQSPQNGMLCSANEDHGVGPTGADGVHTMSADAPPPGSETKASHTPGPLTFIAENIASFSAVGVVATVVCSTLFLYGYLSVFDWRLFWIIDYSDIFKIGLVTLAALAGAIVILSFGLQMLLGIFRLKGRFRMAQIVFLAILYGIGLGIFGLFQLRGPAPYQLYVAWGVAATFLLGLCGVTAVLLTGSITLTAERALGLSTFLFLAVGAADSTFGTVTKYSAGGLRYDVFLKDREMADVRVVLFTSHHTVLYSGELVIVFPTADMVKLVGHPAVRPQQ